MIPYVSFSVTVQGASHIDSGTVCEDSSAHFDDGALHIAVVADGHGDSACFRSGIGSELAVEIAVEQLKTFAADFPAHEADRLLDPEAQKAVARQLAFSLIGTWHNRVAEHYDANPPTEAELASAGQCGELSRSDGDLSRIYGTTLIACLVTEQYLLVLHQGDGRCVMIRQDGKIEQPVPWDSRCEGRFTTSLCSADAVDACRFYVSDQRTAPVVAVFALTDGVEDSYQDMDGVSAFCSKLTARCAENGAALTAEQLAQELPEFSRLGSGDDVSVAAILNPEAAAQHLDSFRLRSELAIGRQRAYLAGQRLDSMFLKRRNLLEDLEQVREKYEHLERRKADIARQISALIECIRTYGLQIKDTKFAASEAALALDAANRAYAEFDAEYQKQEAEKREGEAQLQAAEAALREMGLLDGKQAG